MIMVLILDGQNMKEMKENRAFMQNKSDMWPISIEQIK